MAVLEVLLVGVPLLLLSGWTPLTGRGRPISSTAWVVCVAVLYSLLLVTLHLPSIHDRGASMDLLPWWLPMLVVITGIGYWTAILTTAGSVRLAVRRGALVIAQEVAFVLGLAALIAPSPAMQHTNLLGLSPTMDHRMGGLLMIVTCAAVALPLLKRLDARRESPETRTEHNVH
jgi:hypothetical protein